MRAERNREKEKLEKIRRQKIKKRILIVLILLLIIGVTAETAVLLSMANIDRRFTRSVSRGLQAGWAFETGEMQMQRTGRITDTSFIDAEYSAISDYVDHTYKDDELGKLANEYISALKACKKAAKNHDPSKQFSKFWNDFSAPYARRVLALYRLYQGDFGMSTDNESYIEEYSNLMAQGWLLDMIDGQQFRREDDGKKIIFSARVTNDSGFDIEYLDLTIDLLDQNGKRVDKASVYVSDIPAGKIMVLEFASVSGKAAKYKITGEVMKLGDRQQIQPEEEDS